MRFVISLLALLLAAASARAAETRTAIEPDAAYFSGLTLRRDGDTLISGAVSEYVFRYRRAG